MPQAAHHVPNYPGRRQTAERPSPYYARQSRARTSHPSGGIRYRPPVRRLPSEYTFLVILTYRPESVAYFGQTGRVPNTESNIRLHVLSHAVLGTLGFRPACFFVDFPPNRSLFASGG